MSSLHHCSTPGQQQQPQIHPHVMPAPGHQAPERQDLNLQRIRQRPHIHLRTSVEPGMEQQEADHILRDHERTRPAVIVWAVRLRPHPLKNQVVVQLRSNTHKGPHYLSPPHRTSLVERTHPKGIAPIHIQQPPHQLHPPPLASIMERSVPFLIARIHIHTVLTEQKVNHLQTIVPASMVQGCHPPLIATVRVHPEIMDQVPHHLQVLSEHKTTETSGKVLSCRSCMFIVQCLLP
jgi:hypothetical protein